MSANGSTVIRRQLGRRLRRLRNQANKTEHDVETTKLLGRTKLWRIETGKTSVRIGDVRALCWFYAVDAATTDALAHMALGTVEQNWWEAHNGAVPEWFGLYVGLESSAADIRLYEPELVHGLFQTTGYAHAVYEASQPEVDRSTIDRHVQLRMRRQENLFHRTPPPTITAIFNAAVLARQVGSADIMATQRQQLLECAANTHVDVRILPWSSGAHAAMLGSFAILDFADADDPAVVYVELHVGARYLEKPAELTEYRRVFHLTFHQTIPIREYIS